MWVEENKENVEMTAKMLSRGRNGDLQEFV